jgi:hypothetical protein
MDCHSQLAWKLSLVRYYVFVDCIVCIDDIVTIPHYLEPKFLLLTSTLSHYFLTTHKNVQSFYSMAKGATRSKPLTRQFARQLAYIDNPLDPSQAVDDKAVTSFSSSAAQTHSMFQDSSFLPPVRENSVGDGRRDEEEWGSCAVGWTVSQDGVSASISLNLLFIPFDRIYVLNPTYRRLQPP